MAKTYNKPASDQRDALAARIRRLRADHDYGQALVAERLGVTADAYRKWEERNGPPAWAIPVLCELYNVPAWYLLTGRSVDPHAFQPDEPADQATASPPRMPPSADSRVKATAEKRKRVPASGARSQAYMRRKPE